MNPDTNRFEELMTEAEKEAHADTAKQLEKMIGGLVRPDGSPVPPHWSVFQIDELVVIKNYTFRVAYIGETAILFEPEGPAVIADPTAGTEE